MIFFDEWISIINNSKTYQNLINNFNKANCYSLQAMILELAFTNKQLALLNGATRNLKGNSFAICSSATAEDLKDSSFAGMYETYLGVKLSEIQPYLRKAFSASYAYRVLKYKIDHNLPIEDNKLGLIIQEQLASEISGVAFSLNPLNNAYDQVVVNAAFGLGEAIVSGLVTPYTYIFDTIKQSIISEKINPKQIKLVLSHNGVQEEANSEPLARALTKKQLVEVIDLVKACEEYYGYPVDIEWAIYDNQLYLLQARVITTYFPLFKYFSD